MASDDVYVVTGTALLRRVKGEDGDFESANITRGTEFSVGDTFSDADTGVTDREVKRWLGLQPRVIATKADLEAAQQSAADQAALIADLQAQLEQANRTIAAAVAQGADLSSLGGDDRTGGIAPGASAAGLEQPAGNASADDWKAYAKSVAPADEHEAIDAMSRDELRDKYGKAS